MTEIPVFDQRQPKRTALKLHSNEGFVFIDHLDERRISELEKLGEIIPCDGETIETLIASRYLKALKPPPTPDPQTL